MYIYIYIYIYMDCTRSNSKTYLVHWSSRHLYLIDSGGLKLECIYICIYIYIYVCVCV